MVQAYDEEHSARVIVMDDMLSLAIGKDGQNARLAAKLTGWKIDIKPYSAIASLEAEDEAAEAALQEEQSESGVLDIFEEDFGDL
jgi:N utilization substance protein A